MLNILKIANRVALTSACFIASASALPRVWVSPQGVDVGTCGSATSPCKTFQFATALVDANGEISVRDPGDFGAVSINKSLSIVNHTGGTAAIGTPLIGQTAVTVGVGAGDVYLHGLTLNGFGKGQTGILHSGNGKLVIADLIIQNFTNGVICSNADSTLILRSSILLKNANFGARLVSNKTEIFKTSFSGSLYGLAIGSSATVGKNATAIITDSEISQNTLGLVIAAATVSIGETKIFKNSTGIINSSAMPPVVNSYQNNYILSNGTDVVGTLTPVTLK